MNISYKWLKRFIDPEVSPRELSARLTSLGLECDTVEEVESIRGGLRGIVTGRVLTCVDHPDSDHLHITTVDLGDGEATQIVCGAPNVAAGQNVVVATVGTTLYDGDKEFQIRKSKIRGVESFGMICAEDEIGIGASHDGIMVLPDDVKPGTPAAEYFKVESDYVLEVELTPNRVDAASHLGVARDIKAKMWCEAAEGQREDYPEVMVPSVEGFHADREDGAVSIRIEDKEGCPRYCGVTIRDVEVKESPEWLKNLLNAVGQRPINNIVDITNFILQGIGQPLHCFDLAKVKGEEIVVRTCPSGTKFTTLDGVERELDASDLMICNSEEPMCIAGVFGGLDSGVTDATKSVFIESAYFNPTRVRRTARRHGLSTDASFRYERGTDPNICDYAARLAAVMIKELAGGEICGGVKDLYEEPVKMAEMDFSLDYCARLIGKTLPKELIICILKALEFDVEEKDADTLHLKVPTYRVDVYRPCDVVEEILRVYGYNNVEISDQMHVALSQRGDTDRSYALEQLVSEQLTAQGFNEILNNSLTAVSYYENSELLPLSNCVKLMNPLSNDLAVLRQTLLYGGLESISHNVNRKEANLKFYEFGKVYSFDPSKEASAEKPLAQYSENENLALWITGNISRGSWNVKEVEASVYDLKGILMNIFSRVGIAESALKMEQGSDEIFAAKLDISFRSGKHLASVGIIRSAVLKRFEIEQSVVYASVDWTALYKQARKTDVKYVELPKTQPVERDLALLVDKSVKFAELEEVIRKAERKLLRDVRLFDVYEGKNLPEGKKSYAVKMTLQDMEKTLNDKQIEATMGKIIKSLQGFGAELR
ncbi:MAG: phenylalanine--tRNA ligase subunit beta [Bacteroides sp.]|nr:phenylalanine--tRNA ligase subunit beta [Bacteroides sp.]MDE6257762.1 phenylalanine--tRNA ligase subunit beta [Muribaculaceae bacterium]